jgi:Protein of unknown function (DUF3102)
MTITENVESEKATELSIPDPDEIRPRRPIPRDEIIEVEKWHQELYDLKRLALNRLRRLALNRAFDIGFKLRCWHDLIPHGKWLPWLRANVQIPERTASQYLLLWDHNEEIKSAFNSESADLGELPPIKDALALIANKRAEKRTGEPPSDGIKAKQVVHRIPAAGTSVAAPCPESAAGQVATEPKPSNGALTRTGRVPLERAATQQETDELLVITQVKKFLRELSKVIPEERYRHTLLKYMQYKFGTTVPEDQEEEPNRVKGSVQVSGSGKAENETTAQSKAKNTTLINGEAIKILECSTPGIFVANLYLNKVERKVFDLAMNDQAPEPESETAWAKLRLLLRSNRTQKKPSLGSRV